MSDPKNGLRFDPRAWAPDEHVPAEVEVVQPTPSSPVETRRASPPSPMPRNARQRPKPPIPEIRATFEEGTREPWASWPTGYPMSWVLPGVRPNRSGFRIRSRVSIEFISGRVTVNDNNMVMLLDIDKLFDLSDQYVFDDARVDDSWKAWYAGLN